MFRDRDRSSTVGEGRNRGRPAIPGVRSVGRGALLAAVLAMLLGALFALNTPQARAQNPPPASTDATLSQWEWRISGGGSNIDHCRHEARGNILGLNTAFASGTTAYSQTLSYHYGYASLKTKTSDDGASVAVTSGSRTFSPGQARHGFGSHQTAYNNPQCKANGAALSDLAQIDYFNHIPLAYGETTITVTVTAESGATKTYTVTITRGISVRYSVVGVDSSDNEYSLPYVHHGDRTGYNDRNGYMVEEGQRIGIKVDLSAPTRCEFDLLPRVWLTPNNRDRVHDNYGNAEFADLGLDESMVGRINTPGGWWYVTFGTQLFSVGEGDRTLKFTLAEDDDKETDTFVVVFDFDLRQLNCDRRLVQNESHYPRVGVVIRDNDAPNAPRNLAVTPGDQRLNVRWDPPTGSSMPRIGGMPWNWRHYYSRGDNRAITLNGYEVQVKESSAGDARGTPGNPSTGWTTVARHFSYDDDTAWTDSRSQAEVQAATSKGSWTIRNLKPNTSYDVRVRGHNRDVGGAWATATQVRTPSGVVVRPRITTGWTATLTAGQTKHAFGIGCLQFADAGTNQVPCGDQTWPKVEQGVLDAEHDQLQLLVQRPTDRGQGSLPDRLAPALD